MPKNFKDGAADEKSVVASPKVHNESDYEIVCNEIDPNFNPRRMRILDILYHPEEK